MPISHTDQLFNLVKSLSKAEKRNFRIYSSRIQNSHSMKYIQLFDILEKQDELDEKIILKRFPKSQLPNLKRHLYSQILISLRLIHKGKHAFIEIRELLDFADILYGKGLYLQSLKILEKAKVLADKANDDLMYLQILEFEKLIESRHITRSGSLKSRELFERSTDKLEASTHVIRLSNLKIFLHGLYIQNGHVKSKKDEDEITSVFEENISKIPVDKLNTIERVYLYQSFVWYYYILIDFSQCYRYALNWVNLLKKEKDHSVRDPNLLMRGYHYLLTSAFNMRDVIQYNKYLEELETYRKNNYKKFNTNTQIVSFLYVHNGRLNSYFLLGEFENGLLILPSTLRRINKYGDKLDAHRIMVLYFKIAWMNLGAGKPSNTVKYLNKILTMEVGFLREDIQGYSRLMMILAHYELENFDIIPYLIANAEHYFKKVTSVNEMQKKTLIFFKKVSEMPLNERVKKFEAFEKELLYLYHNKYESKAFLYLDILSWIRSKISGKTLAAITKETLVKK